MLTHAIAIIRAGGFEATPLGYDYAERGGTRDCAAKLGISEHLVIKTLVFDNGQAGAGFRAVVALMHGDGRVSMHKLERLANIRHLKPSEPDTALAITGYVPGGICPFGMRMKLPVIMQHTINGQRHIFINGGRRGLVLRIAPQALGLLSPLAGDIRSEAVRQAHA